MKEKLQGLWKKIFSSEHLSFKDLFFVSLVGIPGQLSSFLLYTMYLKYFTDVVGLKPQLVGVIFLVLSIWNMVNDPITGVWLDRMSYDPKKGKYVHIMRKVFPAIVIPAFGMIFVQGSWQNWVVITFLLVLMFIYETAHTAYSISNASYTILRVTTSEERVELSLITNYLANIFSFFITLIPLFLLVGETNDTLVTIALAGITLLNAGLYWFATGKIKDDPELYKNDMKNADAQLLEDLKHYAGDLFRSKGFWVTRLYSYIAPLGVSFYFTYFLYYMDHIVESTSTQAFIIDTTVGLLMFAVMPFIPSLHRKLGVKKAYLLALIPATIGFAILYFVNTIWGVFFVFAMIVISHGALSVIGGPIGGLIIDEDEQRSGVRKTGFFNSIGGLLVKPADGLRTLIFTTVLAFYGYDGTLKVQSPRAIEGLRVSSSVIPFMAMLLYIAAVLLLPYTKEVEEQIRDRALELRRGGDDESSTIINNPIQ